jgi:hypothetical protein
VQSECEIEPYRRLWAAVLSNAILDALAPTRKAARDGHHRVALRWLGSRNYRLACDLAGVCPDRLMTALAPRLEKARAGDYAAATNDLVSDGRLELRRAV